MVDLLEDRGAYRETSPANPAGVNWSRVRTDMGTEGPLLNIYYSPTQLGPKGHKYEGIRGQTDSCLTSGACQFR